jgi:hypothetical protein
MQFLPPRCLYAVDCEKWDIVLNDSPILKHPGTKENGKNVSIKAIWHNDRVVIDACKQHRQLYPPAWNDR